MRPPGTAKELERRRRLAVKQVLEKRHTQAEVAKFLGVSRSSVSNWMRAYRETGMKGLRSKPHPGRPPRLSPEQESEVLGWFSRSPTEFGFPNELWTASRVTELIRRHWKVKFHPRYISAWLADRRITPQKPRRVPRERNDVAIEQWLRTDWPRIQNGPDGTARALFLSTKAG
jgi:transposase